MVIFHMVIVYDCQGRGHVWICISAWSIGRESAPARLFAYECVSMRACKCLRVCECPSVHFVHFLVEKGHLTENCFRDGHFLTLSFSTWSF
jgi:hypothetical protein